VDTTGLLQAAIAERYAIEREIGAGGMATVYLARDIKHDRQVALKVLKPELGAVLGVDRFLAEIKVTAHLQHPNLLPLFDSGEASGLLFYVMPFVEGESLRARLDREKQLPVDEAVRIAVAVANALDYAHKHGVIHRDLKPGNILIQSGQPVVADFGIALAVTNAGGQRITQSGLSVGTPQYMSPEQATGERTVDGRTDIYSLGAVTYEMLTGDPPHVGTTTQAIIAKLMTEDVRPINVLRRTVPPYLDAAVRHALEKLPADRFATAHEFSEALSGRLAGLNVATGAALDGTLTATPPNGARKRGVAAIPWLVAGAAIAAMAWALGSRGADHDATPVAVTFDVPQFRFNTSVSSVGVSRDGETVAYVEMRSGERRLMLRTLSDPTPRAVAGASEPMTPVFSPDGKSILFSSGGKWRKIATTGGPSESIAESPLSGYDGAAWGASGTIMIGGGRAGLNPGLGLQIIDAAGGPGRLLTRPKFYHARPLLLDDGETVVFVDWGPGFTEDDFLGVGSVRTGEYALSKILAVQPLGVIDGWLVYLTADGKIMAVRLDAKRRALVGEPVRLLEGVLANPGAAALSPSGTLVYGRGTDNRRLVLRDSSGVTPVSDELRNYWEPRFSPDGQRIAVPVATGTGADGVNIWILDRRLKTLTRLTSVGNVRDAAWTRDGKRIVFHTWEGKSPAIWMQSSDGSAPAEKVLERPEINAFQSVEPTPDGRGIVFGEVSAARKCSLFYMALDAKRKLEPLLSDVCAGRLSPDGRWLAYVSSESGAEDLSIRPFHAPGGRVQVSSGGADFPVWSRDGRRLFYIGPGGRLTVAVVRQTGATLEVVSRRPMPASFGVLSDAYDVTPDGRQVLTMMDSDEPLHYVVVKNWSTEFRARIRGR
jgi:serine/threonine-protein kinase